MGKNHVVEHVSMTSSPKWPREHAKYVQGPTTIPEMLTDCAIHNCVVPQHNHTATTTTILFAIFILIMLQVVISSRAWVPRQKLDDPARTSRNVAVRGTS